MYNPGISYQGSNYLYDAIGGLGQDVADALKKREDMKITDQYNDLVMTHAYQDGKISEEDLNKYLSGSHTQKTAIAAEHAAKIVNDWKQQSQQAELAQKQTQTALGQAQLNQTGPYAPDPMAGQPYYHPDTGEVVGVHGQNGQVQFFPSQASGGADEAMQVDPFTDPVTGKPVQGMGIVRKTGAIGYFQSSGMDRDPKTGALGVRDTKGNFKPLNAQQLTAMSMDPNNPVQQSATPTPTPGIMQRIFGSTAPAPSQTPTDATSGASPDLPTLARKALNDPNATAEQKAAAQRIVGAPLITTKADYDALPSGSLYIAPDGSTRRKP